MGGLDEHRRKLRRAGWRSHLAAPDTDERNLPKGNYQPQCKGCRLLHHRTVLSCSHCPTYKNAGSAMGESSIPLTKCLEFGFIGSKLDCTVPNSEGRGLPDGTYKHSCIDCQVVGYHLECAYCTKLDGSIGEKTRLEFRDCRAVGNQQGELFCEVRGSTNLQISAGNDLRTSAPAFLSADSSLPPGTYQSSCYSCTMVKKGTRLSCERCLYGHDRFKQSFVDVQHCDSFSNDNGNLRCDSTTKSLAAMHENEEEEEEEEDEESSCTDPSKAELSPHMVSSRVVPYDGMPAGTYSESCVGCEVTKKVMLYCKHCWGATSGRRNGPSKISLLGCRSFGCREGQLICDLKDYVVESTRIGISLDVRTRTEL